MILCVAGAKLAGYALVSVVICRQLVFSDLAELKNLICPSFPSDLNIELRIRLVPPTTHAGHRGEGGCANYTTSEEDTYCLAFVGDVKVGEHGDDGPPIKYLCESKAFKAQGGYLAPAPAVRRLLI
jgi:hypothetical protein